jgi:hypothetical protein
MPDPTPTPSTPSAAPAASSTPATPSGATNAPVPAANSSAPAPAAPNDGGSLAPAPAATQGASSSPPGNTPPTGSTPPSGDAGTDPVGDWPADWREKYAAGDEKALKRLGRYASPKAALDALFNAQNRITSGELKTALKPDATPEEKAAWRVENGIPDEPGKYELTLKDGMVLREGDKPVVDAFLKVAHDRNMRQEDVTEVLSWWAGEQEQQAQAALARDAEVKMKTEDDLRAEYGPEFRRNLKIAHDTVPDAVREELFAARMPDGTPVGSNPAVVRWLVQLGRELNPISTVVPGSGTNAIQALESELGSLRTMMGDRKSEYWKGPNAAKHQNRYRELVAYQQKGR